MYSMWSEHNKAMREHPEYQMLGLMDCFGEEMSYYLPYRSINDTHAQLNEQSMSSESQQSSQKESWTKRQWGYIKQLKAEVLHYRKEYSTLLLELEKLRGIASKRKSKY